MSSRYELTESRSEARAVSEPSGCCREENLPLEEKKRCVSQPNTQQSPNNKDRLIKKQSDE